MLIKIVIIIIIIIVVIIIMIITTTLNQYHANVTWQNRRPIKWRQNKVLDSGIHDIFDAIKRFS